MTDSPTYVFGDDRKELARLQRQAEYFAKPTVDILKRAGLGAGVRVLDIGCGVGDVSLVAADLVGPTGAMVGIDQSGEALAVARARAASTGRSWISFEERNIASFNEAGL